MIELRFNKDVPPGSPMVYQTMVAASVALSTYLDANVPEPDARARVVMADWIAAAHAVLDYIEGEYALREKGEPSNG